EHEAGSQQQPVQISDDDFENDWYNEDASSIPLQTAPDTKVHVLEDSHIAVLSHSVLKKYKPKKLKCPRGMQEAEFLKLLRSTFPQLAADRPFEYFKTNLTKKLLPLNLESITPEQICSAAGSSALYIRLKVLHLVPLHLHLRVQRMWTQQENIVGFVPKETFFSLACRGRGPGQPKKSKAEKGC
ncbi:hypothetical protein XENOCAPTIV_001583, partial [Xenoophorus captivus]